MYYDPNYVSWGPQGWECPKCHRIYSPSQNMCPYCGSNQRIINSPTTTPYTGDSYWWEEYLKHNTTGYKGAFDNYMNTMAEADSATNIKSVNQYDPILEYIENGFGLPPMDKI